MYSGPICRADSNSDSSITISCVNSQPTQNYYNNIDCSGTPIQYPYSFQTGCTNSTSGPTLSTCTNNQSVVIIGSKTEVATTCKGALQAASQDASADISCFEGFVVSGTAKASPVYLQNSFPADMVTYASYPGQRVCASYSVACPSSSQFPCSAGQTGRFYTGHDKSSQIVATSMNAQVYDVSSCTTSACNSPFTDACRVGGTGGSRTCGIAPNMAPSAVMPAAADISCYTTTNGVTTLSTVRGIRLCIAATISCAAAKAANASADEFTSMCLDTATNPNANAFIRIYINSPEGFSPPVYFPSSFFLSDIVICNTAGCNKPDTDSCALAKAPVIATVAFSGLPDTAIANGKIANSALAVLQNAVSMAVATSCPGCTSLITSVADASTGQVYYTVTAGSRRAADASAARARALAEFGVVVTFSTTGASEDTIAAATSGDAFTVAATSFIAAEPDFEGAKASSVTVETAAPASIIPAVVGGAVGGAAALLFIVLVGCWCCNSACFAQRSKVADKLVKTGPPALGSAV